MHICERDGVTLNVSDVPRIGFWEFNILPEKLTPAAINTTADFIQIIVDFLTHHFGSQTQSYNIFFYDLGSRIAVKLLPRFATPPIFVGYGIHFRPSSLDEAIHAIRQRYF